VVSNSTLDHFDDLGEVAVALAELRRVLRPGGTLVVSLDNLANPIVGVRNLLPSRVRYGSGLVPYYVGATCGPWRMARMLDAAGFDVRSRGAMMDGPARRRGPAVRRRRSLPPAPVRRVPAARAARVRGARAPAHALGDRALRLGPRGGAVAAV
jgi:SAM-dependent methyltransferase